ncbi:PGN_0703 family putative restriction endonuclease [Pseudoduganella albidiflava]|uniref:PD-(D/E)XK nuclease-like domain-containing protein n=1 Tax=Pseudoduganella albidiflava TaxID=321983 RepID=A0A411X2Z6_9BURK|nr:hypothetical protein [Pseudoduganella albidiflava]QBI03242.1 hypothetical protein EYF70_22235 [Pseudoduganella albidiflava]GGY69079.1 hypothetical protein GCM10007387_58930 [Pseudoduganella albidiflava]
MHQQHPSLYQQVGNLPDESQRKRRIRFHQGWWRTFVLTEAAGAHPLRAGETVCNVLDGGEISKKNLFGPGTVAAVEATLAARSKASGGLIDQRRLFNNLLSSQPLVFNFFGPLQQDLALATRVVQALFPGVDEVTAILFEYAPDSWIDNSAFDVALEITSQGRSGLLGLECKFTEPFSPTEYNTEDYRKLATACEAFTVPYEACIKPEFNQLFRNQLIAEHQVREKKKYAFRMTGLFCEPGDDSAIATGKAFRAMLRDGDSSFHVVTYTAFIEALQRLELTWEQREWSMMLWARYCALGLSAGAYGER